MSASIMRIEKALTAPKECMMTEIFHLDNFKRAFKEAATMLNVGGIMSTIEIWGSEWDEGIRIGEITKSEIQYVQAVINLDSRKMSDVRDETNKNPESLTIPKPPADPPMESSISSSQPNISPDSLQTAEKSPNKITESSNKSQVSNMQAPKHNGEGMKSVTMVLSSRVHPQWRLKKNMQRGKLKLKVEIELRQRSFASLKEASPLANIRCLLRQGNCVE